MSTDSEVRASAQRRNFRAAEKASMLAEYDAAKRRV